MSCTIDIRLPGLTRDVAEDLARRADLAGALRSSERYDVGCT